MDEKEIDELINKRINEQDQQNAQQSNYNNQQNFNNQNQFNNYNQYQQNGYNQYQQNGYNQYQQPSYAPESKTALGIVCGLFLGLIGLIIGLCCYREGSLERKTFMKAWGITFGISIALEIVSSLLAIFVFGLNFYELLYL